MSHSCNGNCGNCGGCSGQLMLTQPELDFLKKLGQIPFLPVARKACDMLPVYLEDAEETPELYTRVLLNLEAKGLISLDYDNPLPGVDMTAYVHFPVRGSIALTQWGQQVLETLELQGIE